MATLDSGIDYGHGQTNIDRETGIRYGVISSNRLASHAWDTIQSEGTDLDYAEALEELTDNLTSSLKSILADYDPSFDCKAAAEQIISEVEFNIEPAGDFARYEYSDAEVTFTLCSDGDIFVTKSKYYTLCFYCSPCAPGAGYLESEGNVKAYCLPPAWFDSDSPIPYKFFPVEQCEETLTAPSAAS